MISAPIARRAKGIPCAYEHYSQVNTDIKRPCAAEVPSRGAFQLSSCDRRPSSGSLKRTGGNETRSNAVVQTSLGHPALPTDTLRHLGALSCVTRKTLWRHRRGSRQACRAEAAVRDGQQLGLHRADAACVRPPRPWVDRGERRRDLFYAVRGRGRNSRPRRRPSDKPLKEAQKFENSLFHPSIFTFLKTGVLP